MSMKTPALLIGSIVALVGLFACSSSNSTTPGTTSSTSSGAIAGCNSNPWSCTAGQTCFPVDVNETAFTCQTSGKGKAGDKCTNHLTPECADGLACLATAGYPLVCTPYCDPSNAAHGCPNNEMCQAFQTPGGQKLYLCLPQGGSGGGSTSSSSSSTSTSTSSSSSSSGGGAGGKGAGGAGGKGAGGAGGGP
jgi:hypothetical protein